MLVIFHYCDLVTEQTKLQEKRLVLVSHCRELVHVHLLPLLRRVSCQLGPVVVETAHLVIGNKKGPVYPPSAHSCPVSSSYATPTKAPTAS